MNDQEKQPEDRESRILFTSKGCDLLEIKEEDTQPGEVSESFRRWLEAKYGRKTTPPPNREKP